MAQMMHFILLHFQKPLRFLMCFITGVHVPTNQSAGRRGHTGVAELLVFFFLFECRKDSSVCFLNSDTGLAESRKSIYKSM